jgi:DNA primase
MDDTPKYLIHAAITANGVVERSDVVGAVFGQTEGLLGEELDLRDLQQSSKVGRIDVEIESENGQSFGRITVASSLDRVKTAILAASLETISRVGPCRSTVEVTGIEDVRSAKRREVVDRAKELLAESFEESIITSTELLEEVRESVRVEDIDEYEGLPSGPNVADSDAVIVVEGRADVLTLLDYGIKNAVAVEGTNVPDVVAALTRERTVTAFLDGDRGGELILRELAQVGDVDYVAFAPEGRSVEDLSRSEALSALREKVPFDATPDDGDIRSTVAAVGTAALRAEDADRAGRDEQRGVEETTDGDAEPTSGALAGGASAGDVRQDAGTSSGDGDHAPDAATPVTGVTRPPPDGDATDEGDADGPDEGVENATDEAVENATDEAGTTLRDHVEDVVGEGTVRLLDEAMAVSAAGDAEEAFDLLEAADEAPFAVVLDGELSQRVLDVAAQRGVAHVVAAERGEFVKQPVDVRVRTAEELRGSA